MSLVYEVLNNVGLRVLFVADEGIAKELCLSSGRDLSYRPVYVAEDYGSAKTELKRRY